jgi:hypothetical protein
MVPHLIDQRARLRQRSQPLTILDGQYEWLLTEDVQAMFECRLHHGCVQIGRRANEHGIESFLPQHFIASSVTAHTRILRQHASDIRIHIACGDHLRIRVCVDNRMMRQSHFAQPNHGNADHNISPAV